MYRLATVLLVALGACSIEPTPREFIDRQPAAAEIRQRTEAQLRAHVTAIVRALEAGDVEAARSLLSPAADVVIVGFGPGEPFIGTQQVDALVELAAAVRPGALRLQDLHVGVGPRASVGWFAAWLELQPLDEPATSIRVTGVLLEREGTWELQQAHVSAPTDLPLP